MTHRPARPRDIRMTAGLVVSVAVLAIAAAACGPGTGAGDPSPGVPSSSGLPSAAPSAPADPAPSVGPTPPVEHPPIEGDITVDLTNQTGHAITATVRDDTDTLVDARSGNPGSGMSVFWHDIAVHNLDARTIRVTWVGLAIDDKIHVAISFERDKYLIDIVQTGPEPNADASGFDRELILRFTQPVVADEVIGGVADMTPA